MGQLHRRVRVHPQHVPLAGEILLEKGAVLGEAGVVDQNCQIIEGVDSFDES